MQTRYENILKIFFVSSFSHHSFASYIVSVSLAHFLESKTIMLDPHLRAEINRSSFASLYSHASHDVNQFFERFFSSILKLLYFFYCFHMVHV